MAKVKGSGAADNAVERTAQVTGANLSNNSSFGNDTLAGGSGADTFVIPTGADLDTITDFEIEGDAHDVLDLSNLEGIDIFLDLGRITCRRMATTSSFAQAANASGWRRFCTRVHAR